MSKFNDPIEDVVNGFRDGFTEDREEVDRLKFWGIVLTVVFVSGSAFIYFM